MRWRAALVPLAATLAATLLFSSAAWGQSEEPEPTPEPTAAASPDPTPSVDAPSEEPNAEETPAEEPAEDPVRVEPSRPKDKAADEPVEQPSAPDEGTQEVQGGGPLPQLLTFYASPKNVTVGKTVHVWGKASPQGGSRWVSIHNARTGYKFKSFKTRANGRYEGDITIRSNVALQARWNAVRSEWRRIGAKPRLRVHMSDARLFGRSKISGSISRIVSGKRVKVRLVKLENGRIVDSRRVKVNKAGRFKTGFTIDKPGTYRASATFKHENWRKAVDKTGGSQTPTPSLSRGSSGVYVKLLEKRLDQLGHHLNGRNYSYGVDTADAVMAFNKVNRRSRVSYVTSSTWDALARAHRPKPRYDKPGFHIEVNQSKQVLYVVKKGKVRAILHVSTGAPSTPTYDGTYQFWGKVAGYSPKRLYYPSYFHGARAIHGWPEVPPYNASHGCVRVPMWAAKWIYAKTEIGDTIRIYH